MISFAMLWGIACRDADEPLYISRIRDDSVDWFEGYIDDGETRKVLDVFERGDRWFNTGDLLKVMTRAITGLSTDWRYISVEGRIFQPKSIS